MKNILLFIAVLIGMRTTSAQVKALKVNHPDSEKVIVIKENKRTIVKTKMGEKVKGRLMFVDDETISLKGQEILLADVVKIQHNPLILSIVIDGLIFYVGGALAGIGLLVAAFGGSAGAAIAFAVPAAALMYAAATSTKVTKGYKPTKIGLMRRLLYPIASKLFQPGFKIFNSLTGYNYLLLFIAIELEL